MDIDGININVGDIVKYYHLGKVVSVTYVMQDICSAVVGQIRITVEALDGTFIENILLEDVRTIYKPAEDIKADDLIIYKSNRGKSVGTVTHKLTSSECSRSEITLIRVCIISNDQRVFENDEYIDVDNILEVYREVKL